MMQGVALGGIPAVLAVEVALSVKFGRRFGICEWAGFWIAHLVLTIVKSSEWNDSTKAQQARHPNDRIFSTFPEFFVSFWAAFE